MPKRRKLFIGQIPHDFNESALLELFSKYGVVEELNLVRDPLTLQSKGCAFLSLDSASACEAAIEELHGIVTLPRSRKPLCVRMAHLPPEGDTFANTWKLYAAMLPKEMDEDALRNLFGSYGEVVDAHIMRDLDGQSKGCGFVRFATYDEAHAAMVSLNNTHKEPNSNVPIQVRFAHTREEKQMLSSPLLRMLAPQVSAIHPAAYPAYVPDYSGVVYPQYPATSYPMPLSPTGEYVVPQPAAYAYFPVSKSARGYNRPGPAYPAAYAYGHAMYTPATAYAAPMSYAPPTVYMVPSVQEQAAAPAPVTSVSQRAVESEEEKSPSINPLTPRTSISQADGKHFLEKAHQPRKSRSSGKTRNEKTRSTSRTATAQRRPKTPTDAATQGRSVSRSRNTASGSVPHSPANVTATPANTTSQATQETTAHTVTNTDSAAESNAEYLAAVQAPHEGVYPVQPLFYHTPAARGPAGANLFIYGIPESCTDYELFTLFAPFGHIVSVSVPKHRSNNAGKGYGFVSYNNVASAQTAVRELNGIVLRGKAITVSIKKSGFAPRTSDAHDASSDESVSNASVAAATPILVA